VDRLFLDANVLFSAAYSTRSPILRLWSLGVELLTSAYAIEEARRNLATATERGRLADLLRAVRVVPESSAQLGSAGSSLPAKDRPILAAAVAANATFLVTGDYRHFGALYGHVVGGVEVVSPAAYASQRGKARR
jgi:uncharacterized protein